LPHPSHAPWFDHPNNIWWRVQVMTLLIMQSSPVFFKHSVILLRLFHIQKSISTIHLFHSQAAGLLLQKWSYF
jgi:hypothetical protein